MIERLHPYALIMGLGIGLMVGVTLRHPIFAIFTAIVATVLLDMGFKRKNNKE